MFENNNKHTRTLGKIEDEGVACHMMFQKFGVHDILGVDSSMSN